MIDYLLLPLAVVCLCTPLTLVCGRSMRGRLGLPARSRAEGIVPLMKSWLNWVDIARGAAGGWLILNHFPGAKGAQDELALTITAVQIAILSLGVLAQTAWIRRPARVIGPVFYLVGLTFSLCGPIAGGISAVIALSCALLLGRLSLVFVLAPPAVLACGFLFGELGIMTVFSACALAVPVFLAFSLGTRLSFVRNTESSSARREVHDYAPASDAPSASVEAPAQIEEELPIERTEAAVIEPPDDEAIIIRPNFGPRRRRNGHSPAAPYPQAKVDVPLKMPRMFDLGRAIGEDEPVYSKRSVLKLFAKGKL